MKENIQETIYNKFLAMEERFTLLSDQDIVAPIWELIRYTMFRAVSTPPRNHKRTTGLVSFFKRNILLSLLHRRRYVFFSHPRRKLESDGCYWDPYTDPIIRQIGEGKTLTVERSWHGRHFRPARTRRVFHLDSLETVARFITATSIIPLTPAQRRKLRAIRRGILRDFGVDADVEKQGTSLYRRYRVYRAFYRLYLRVLKPRVVFLVASNVHGALIEAARGLRIPTVELQHAIISRYYTVLNYEGYRRKRQAPDFLFTFGDFWTRQADFPLPRENVIGVGFPYLSTRLEESRPVKTDTVTFISEFPAGPVLSRLAVETARMWEDRVSVTYKLHPEEYHNWKTRYPELHDAAVEGLLTVIDAQKPHLYDLLRDSRWQVGVSSTALLEGIAFGCKTYLLDHPAIAAMEPFVRENFAVVVNGPENFDFGNDKESSVDFESVFAPDWRERLVSAVRTAEQYYTGTRP